MAVTSSRDVTSGFFRVHLWVLMGMQSLGALASLSARASGEADSVSYAQFWLAVSGAIASYVGSVVWLYERPIAGKFVIWIVAGTALMASLLPVLNVVRWPALFGNARVLVQIADCITSGRLLGFVVTAMLLGHWYLNTPTMRLDPLKWLLRWLAVAVLLRMVICAFGDSLAANQFVIRGLAVPTFWVLFLALRWLSGLIGVLVLTWMTWQTLKIPNTQSATGILYAAVVLAFIGELTSELLSAGARYPA